MMKLTPTQQTALDKLSKIKGQCSYELGVSLATLEALVKKGKAKRIQTGGNLGAMFSPRTVYEFVAI